MFEPLRQDQIKAIVGLQVQRLVLRLADQRIKLHLTDTAIEYLAAKVGGLPSGYPTRGIIDIINDIIIDIIDTPSGI